MWLSIFNVLIGCSNFLIFIIKEFSIIQKGFFLNSIFLVVGILLSIVLMLKDSKELFHVVILMETLSILLVMCLLLLLGREASISDPVYQQFTGASELSEPMISQAL
eukprot:UN26839